MLVTSSKNKNAAIVNDIIKKTKNTIHKQLIVDLVSLTQQAPNYHKEYDSDQIITWFINPILKNQYFTLYENNKLVAFLTYGYLDAQTEHKWLTKGYEFALDDWDSGKSLWLIDCIAPWGHAPKICKIARINVANRGFNNKKVNFKRRYKSGKEKLASAVI